MKLPEPPKIVEPLSLGGYAKEFDGVTVQVWVNPTLALFSRYTELNTQAQENLDALKKLREAKKPDEDAIKACAERANEIGRGRVEWLSQMWSQSPDADTHWTPEEIQTALIEAYGDTDPKLFFWACVNTWLKIAEHRTVLKNVSRTPLPT